MSSFGKSYAQNVLRSFVVTQEQWGAYYFTQSDIDTWYEANELKINKIGDVYIIPGGESGSTFIDVLEGNNGATAFGRQNTPRITARKTIKDMGREVIIGNSIVTRLLVLRRVQKYTNSTDGGSLNPEDTVYVIVENNAEDLANNSGRFTVRVARI